jgi:hypothetical protein
MISRTISPRALPVAPLSKYPTAARISVLASLLSAKFQSSSYDIAALPICSPDRFSGESFPLKLSNSLAIGLSPCWTASCTESLSLRSQQTGAWGSPLTVVANPSLDSPEALAINNYLWSEAAKF